MRENRLTRLIDALTESMPSLYPKGAVLTRDEKLLNETLREVCPVLAITVDRAVSSKMERPTAMGVSYQISATMKGETKHVEGGTVRLLIEVVAVIPSLTEAKEAGRMIALGDEKCAGCGRGILVRQNDDSYRCNDPECPEPEFVPAPVRDGRVRLVPHDAKACTQGKHSVTGIVDGITTILRCATCGFETTIPTTLWQKIEADNAETPR